MNKLASDHKIKAIIFDFDEVLADISTVALEAKEMVFKRQYKLSDEEVESLRKASPQEILKKLNIKKWQPPLLVIKVRREVDEHLDSVEVFQGIPEVLKELSGLGYRLYVVSPHAD